MSGKPIHVWAGNEQTTTVVPLTPKQLDEAALPTNKIVCMLFLRGPSTCNSRSRRYGLSSARLTNVELLIWPPNVGCHWNFQYAVADVVLSFYVALTDWPVFHWENQNTGGEISLVFNWHRTDYPGRCRDCRWVGFGLDSKYFSLVLYFRPPHLLQRKTVLACCTIENWRKSCPKWPWSWG